MTNSQSRFAPVERFMPALGLRIRATLDLQPAVPVIFADPEPALRDDAL
jgi:hypothetical protein